MKVIISALVAVGAMSVYVAVLLLVPALEFLGFGCGIVFSWAVFFMMEGLEECEEIHYDKDTGEVTFNERT